MGTRYKSQQLTKLVGGRVLRPYVPHGMKRIGEGEGHLTYIQSVNFQTESSSMFKVSMFFWINTLSSMLSHCQQ